MRKLLKEAFSDISYWGTLCFVYLASALLIACNAKISTTLFWAFICAVICGIIIFKKRRENSRGETRAIEKKMKNAVLEMKKTGDATIVYKALDEEVLPALRKELPSCFYKYCSLGGDDSIDKQKIDALKNKNIWTSLHSEFNDPFELQYFYLDENAIREINFPTEAVKTWERVIGLVRKHITVASFTQNPNSMPMWAHYANNHNGFCVEYEIIKTNNLYPVLYTKERMSAQVLFVSLLMGFVNQAENEEDKTLQHVLKHIMLLSSYKEESWSSENEIRLIFINHLDEISNGGRLISCEEAGIRAKKIYIGVSCSKENEQTLISIANELGIEYEKCKLSSNKKYGVIEE